MVMQRIIKKSWPYVLGAVVLTSGLGAVGISDKRPQEEAQIFMEEFNRGDVIKRDCMGNKSESLESKLDKPDWKQWLPIWGAHQIVKDGMDGRPTIIYNESEGRIKFGLGLGSALYQAVSIATAVVGTIYGLIQIAEKNTCLRELSQKK